MHAILPRRGSTNAHTFRLNQKDEMWNTLNRAKETRKMHRNLHLLKFWIVKHLYAIVGVNFLKVVVNIKKMIHGRLLLFDNLEPMHKQIKCIRICVFLKSNTKRPFARFAFFCHLTRTEHTILFMLIFFFLLPLLSHSIFHISCNTKI